MITFEINGCSVTLTEETFAAMQAEEAAARREREEELAAWAWLQDPANASDPSYRDVFRDVYGFRP